MYTFAVYNCKEKESHVSLRSPAAVTYKNTVESKPYEIYIKTINVKQLTVGMLHGDLGTRTQMQRCSRRKSLFSKRCTTKNTLVGNKQGKLKINYKTPKSLWQKLPTENHPTQGKN